MTKKYQSHAGRLGGLKLSEDRAHMSAIGAKGGKATASKPGHMRKLSELSAKARASRARNTKPDTPPLPGF